MREGHVPTGSVMPQSQGAALASQNVLITHTCAVSMTNSNHAFSMVIKLSQSVRYAQPLPP